MTRSRSFARDLRAVIVAIGLLFALVGCATPTVNASSAKPHPVASAPSTPTTSAPPTSAPTPVNSGAHFVLSQTDSSGYKTGIDITVSPLQVAVDTADAAPGFNDINGSANLTGAATNLTVGHNQDLLYSVAIFAVFPAASPACSPNLSPANPGVATGASTCLYLVGQSFVGQMAVPSNGEAPFVPDQGGGESPLQLVVPDAQKVSTLAALNAPLGYALANNFTTNVVNVDGMYRAFSPLNSQCSLKMSVFQSPLDVAATSVQGVC